MTTYSNTYTGDATQNSFLSALAYGETGSNGGQYEGTSIGTTAAASSNLSGDATDQYGHIVFGDQPGVSSAEGPFQFVQGTWDSVASQLGLNFNSSSDQDEAAWDVASTDYSNATGGQSLEQAFADGDYSSISSALSGQWPSLTNLAKNVSAGNAGNIGDGTASSSSSTSSSTSTLSEVTALFQRGGLIIVGALVLLIALWALLSKYSDVPSPTQTVQATGKAVMAA